MNAHQNPYDMDCREQDKPEPERQRESTRKNYPKVVINVSDTQYAVVKQVARKLKWNQVSEPFSNMNFDVCWTDAHVKQQTFYKMNQYQRINHFPGMDILSRKNNLGKSLMSFRNRFPEDFQFFPNTWMLPSDYAELKQYHDNRQSGKAQTFIVKPEASCQGRGIFLTRQIDKLKNERCVVQRYLHKPFLIDGLKFDMRIYVLVAGTDPLRIFVYEEGLARLATQPYTAPRTDNLGNHFMHLTNYAINKNSPNFVFNESIEQCDKGHKRSLSSAYKTIGEMGHNVEELKQRINDIIIKTVITGYPTISRIQQTVHPQNYANDMCFEILGLDVMLDSNLNPVLLEVNYTPSFTTDTPLDKHIKKNLIMDTLKLLGITEQWKYTMKKKREAQITQRMLSGKRKRFNLDEKIEAVQHFAKQRDRYESQNMGGFKKIFVKSEEQFQQYRKFYEFAEELYLDQNRLTGTAMSNNYFYIPFLKQAKQAKQGKQTKQGKKRRQKRENSLLTSNNYEQKKNAARSIENRRVATAKSSSKRVIISSSKNLHEQKKGENIEDIYFEENSVLFRNNNLKQAFTKKGKKKQQEKEE